MPNCNFNNPNHLSPQHKNVRCGMIVVWPVAMILLLFSGVVLAELPQRNRPLNYEPITVQHPGTSQSHVAKYPVPEPQINQPASRSSDSRTSRTGSLPDELLNPSLPEPGGPIEPEIQTVLADLSQKIATTKSGKIDHPPDNTPGTPGTDGTENVPPNSGFLIVERIVDIDDNRWIAYEEGGKMPIPVIKSGDRYFTLDGNREVMRPDTSAVTGEQAKEDTKTTLADDQTRNAVMLIVTTIALLAAIGIGMLAFDYKHRWEQEIVSQNSRLLGSTTFHGGTTHGTFAELDPLEPETLRFSPHDYGSLDDSLDHSFRTIA